MRRSLISDDTAQLGFGLKLLAYIFIAFIAVIAIGAVFGFFGETAQVAHEEFSPRAMLDKYEWFKDAAASLDAKRASIDVYETDLKTMVDSYGNTSRKDWSREDKEFYQQRSTDIAGIKASYNKLAADYNAQMAKFNWAFANAGAMPKGLEDKPALPREYREYVTK
jgi:hypothetical protein